jgi:hypothetical protein
MNEGFVIRAPRGGKVTLRVRVFLGAGFRFSFDVVYA